MMIATLLPKGITQLFLLSLTILLAACGGGGGDGGSTKSSSSSAASLVANAGMDHTVNAGTRVELETNARVVGGEGYSLGGGNLVVTGKSTNPKDIVQISWTKIEGPAVALGSPGTTSANAYFVAPSTGTAASVDITYKLTIVTADGTKAEDTVKITVNRVNQAPTANAGADITVDADTIFELTGEGNDVDGDIRTYAWFQSAGEPAQLIDTPASTPTLPSQSFTSSYIAPSVSTDVELEFTLMVIDNDEAQVTDTVTVRVTPSNAPRVGMHFPPPAGIYNGSTISAFGIATPKTGNLTEVTVDIGNGPIAANLDENGAWQLDEIAIPDGLAAVRLEVAATNSLGITGTAFALLQRAEEQSNDHLGLGNKVGIAVDTTKKCAFVLTNSQTDLSGIKLFSVDLVTGRKSADISNFSIDSQGITSFALTSMVYSADEQLIYLATAPADMSMSKKIISINTVNGQRALISDVTLGSGPDFANPTGLALGANNNLYVADNINDAILSVNTLTGDRSVIADSTSFDYAITAPLLLTADRSADDGRLYMIPNASSNYVLKLDLLASPVTTTLVTNSADNTTGVGIFSQPKSIAVDTKGNDLYIVDNFGDLIKVNIATGMRETFLDTGTIGAKVYFDADTQVLYLLGGLTPNLYAINPATGHQVKISRSN